MRLAVMSRVNDGLSEDQIGKRDVIVEDADEGGVTSRHRVTNQTIFDHMLLSHVITVSQWYAAHLFIEDLSASGASIPSVDFKARMEAPDQNRSTAYGERRMQFSAAYRSMVGKCDEDSTKLFMRFAGDPFTVASHKPSLDSIKELEKVIGQNLSCLSRFYKVDMAKDPISIIKRQFGSG